jgi:hypothetical protein
MAMLEASGFNLTSLLAYQETQNTHIGRLSEVEGQETLPSLIHTHPGEPTDNVSPIVPLPNEVLSAIFEAGCLLPPSQPPEPPFEILVSQVTRRWRNVAITTPNLWIQITISSGKHNLTMAET